MILCEVNHSGSIYLNKKVFILDKEIVSELGSDPIGVKDIVDINKIISCGINIITALVNSAENVEEIKSLAGHDTIFFARIETSEAIYNFDSILERSDGIIIQQGLLSSKIPYEDLCLIEMYIIEKCKIFQKPIFMQTCILKSMMHRVKPIITEISNLDHAVNVGVDGLILKEEITLAHNHTEIIKILRETLLGIEALSDSKNKYEELSKFYKIHKEYSFDIVIESILDCAVKTVFDLRIGLIILYTDKYQFAKTLSKYRPNCRIVCVTQNEKTFDYLRLIRGVSPFLIQIPPEVKSLDNFTDKYTPF
jgi:pyruvate kinase